MVDKIMTKHITDREGLKKLEQEMKDFGMDDEDILNTLGRYTKNSDGLWEIEIEISSDDMFMCFLNNGRVVFQS